MLEYAAVGLGKEVQLVNHSVYPNDDLELRDGPLLHLCRRVYGRLAYVAIGEGTSYELAQRAGLAPALRALADDGWELAMVGGAKANETQLEAYFLAERREHVGQVSLLSARSLEEWLRLLHTSWVLLTGRFHHIMGAASVGLPVVAMTGNTPRIGGICKELNISSPLALDSATLAEDVAERTATILAQSPSQARQAGPEQLDRVVALASANMAHPPPADAVIPAMRRYLPQARVTPLDWLSDRRALLRFDVKESLESCRLIAKRIARF